MKTLRNFSDHHPLLHLILFDLVVSALSIGLGFFIRSKTGWEISTIIFLEAMVFLILAYFCFTGNASLKQTNFVQYREFNHDDSSHLAEMVLFKYGGIGVILFFSTWIIR